MLKHDQLQIEWTRENYIRKWEHVGANAWKHYKLSNKKYSGPYL